MNELAVKTDSALTPVIAQFGRWNVDDKGIRRCRECGKSVTGEEIFCPECGLPLQYRRRHSHPPAENSA